MPGGVAGARLTAAPYADRERRRRPRITGRLDSAMQRLQAFKFELRPNGQQQRQMRRFAGACRFVFNAALAMQAAQHQAAGPFIRYVAMAKHLTAWRQGAALPSGRTAPWLAEAPIHPLQHALKDLERAYTNFFAGRAAFPKRKRRGQHDSFRYPDPKQFKLDQGNSRIFLPKLGWMRLRLSRSVPGELRNATVSLHAGRWFVSICTSREVAQPVPSGDAVGIDMGIARFATFSDGSFIAPLDSFKRHEARLRRYQRAMSRKVKFSSNWRKAKARVQRIHARIGNARRNFLHKTTTTISQNHAMVCIEDLQVRNMSKSAAGLSPCRRSTRVAPVRAVATSRRITGKRRRSSCASNAVSRTTLMSSARSMF